MALILKRYDILSRPPTGFPFASADTPVSAPASGIIPPSSATSSTNAPLPPYSVPLTVSLLISESLFAHFYSPAATLIIPFIRVNIPYGYFIIIGMELVTSFLVKLAYGPSYSILSSNLNLNTLPDLNSLRQVYNLAPVRENSRNQLGGATAAEDTPLFPLGITFNISFSSPFSAPSGKTATLFTIQLKEIRNVPGYLVPLISIVLYFLIKVYFRSKSANEDRAQKAPNNNSCT
jgi:hypothetical protein